jgi:transposase
MLAPQPISWGNITAMLLVEIEKPEIEPLSRWFSELRDWLDANHCASTFARTGRRLDRLIYRISFEDAALAHQFLLRFSRYSPTIRRANPFERDQLRKMGKVVAGAAD